MHVSVIWIPYTINMKDYGGINKFEWKFNKIYGERSSHMGSVEIWEGIFLRLILKDQRRNWHCLFVIHFVDPYLRVDRFFKKRTHCVKRVCIRSYSGPYFPTFGLNTEIHLRSQSECGKIRTRITPNTDTFHPVTC